MHINELIDQRMPERAIEIAEEIINAYVDGIRARNNWRALTSWADEIECIEEDLVQTVDPAKLVSMIINGDMINLQRELMRLINNAARSAAKDEDSENEYKAERSAYESRECRALAKSIRSQGNG